MLDGLKRHRKFPLFGTGSALLNTISWQLPTVLLAAFFSPAIVGYYALGTRLLRLPMSLIGGAIAQAFFPRATEAKADGTLAGLVEGAFRRLVAFGMFPLLILTVVGRDLFVVLFGEAWAEAGVYTQILSVWSFFWFISSPLSTLFVTHERQEVLLIFNVLIFGSRVLALGAGGLLGDARLALLLFGGSGILVYGSMCVSALAISGVRMDIVLRILAADFAYFLPAAIVLVVLEQLEVPSLILVGTSVGCLAAYGIAVLSRDAGVRRVLRRTGGTVAAKA